MKTIGESIRDKRKALKITQTKLGDKIGVRRDTISCWERGLYYPNALAICDLADVFECTADELLGRKII